MTDERTDNQGEHSPSKPERGGDILAALLTLPGPRTNIDDAMRDRVYQNVRKEWMRTSDKGSRFRWALPAAIAAGILVAMIAREPAPVLEARPVGSIVLVASQTADTTYAVGQDVRPGDVLDTLGGGGLSLLLNGVTSLRVDGDSLLTIDARDEFTLISGRVYIDTGPAAYGKRSLTVHTVSGSAVDIGTQFSVTFADADMSVAVREGQVDVSSLDSTPYNVMAGDKLTVRPGAAPSRGAVSRVDDSWDWAVSLAPAFDAEGRSLLDFLKWACRESGLELRFANEELRMAAMQIRQYGTAGLSVEDAIKSVFATNDFSYSIDSHTLTVSR